MIAAYLQKNSSESSRWGMQLTLQAGQDTRIFAFSATAPKLPTNLGKLRSLRVISRTSVMPYKKGQVPA
jgi:hypothetical protein